MVSDYHARAQKRAALRYTVNENGCFISTYSTGSHGYAQVGWSELVDGERKAVVMLAHRLAWEFHYGPIEAETLDHSCFERRCINMAHLREMSRADNSARQERRAA